MASPPFRRACAAGCEWLLGRSVGEELELPGPQSILQPVLDAATEAPSARQHVAIGRVLLGRVVACPEATDRVTVARALAHARAAEEDEAVALEAGRLALSAELLLDDLDSGLARLERLRRRPDAPGERLGIDAARLLLDRGELEAGARLLEHRPAEGVLRDLHALGAATLQRAQGRPRVARALLRSVRQRRGWWPELEHELARAAWACGDEAAAVARFGEIARREPGSAAAQANYVISLHASGRRESARAALDEARPSVRGDPRLRRWLEVGEAEGVDASPSRASALEGHLGAIALPDLISLLGHSRSTGVLVLEGGAGRGEIQLREGKLVGAAAPSCLVDAELDGDPERRVLEALERLLDWTDGRFHFETASARELAPDIEMETPVALLHACASLDERKRVAES